MAELKRREFLHRLGQAAAVTAGTVSLSGSAHGRPSKKIRVGQIGTKHGHAAGKMGALRKLDDQYEVVGIVEPDDEAATGAEQAQSAATGAWRKQPLWTDQYFYIADNEGHPDVKIRMHSARLI